MKNQERAQKVIDEYNRQTDKDVVDLDDALDIAEIVEDYMISAVSGLRDDVRRREGRDS